MAKKSINIGIATFACLMFLLVGGEASAQERMTREEYIVKWGHLAIDNMEVYGIPASITMAQALLESGAGNSQLSRASNNHFGIKCKSTWEGEKVYHDDDEKGECFRAYPTVADSYHDHAEFLNNGKRYEFLFAYDITDYQSWAKGLKAAGYATAKDYAERLIRLIEDEHLYLLDKKDGLALYDKYLSQKLGINRPPLAADATNNEQRATSTTTEAGGEVASKGNSKATAQAGKGLNPNNHRVSLSTHAGYNIYTTNGTHYIVATEGDSFETLAKKFRMSASSLRKHNDLGRDAVLSAGDVVYIERKMECWTGSELYHEAKEGDTLHSVAQQYGIRLKKMERMNKELRKRVLKDGEKVFIR